MEKPRLPWGFSDVAFWDTEFPGLPGWQIKMVFVGTADPYAEVLERGELRLWQLHITPLSGGGPTPELTARALGHLRLGRLVTQAVEAIQGSWQDRIRYTPRPPGRPRLDEEERIKRLTPIAQLYLHGVAHGPAPLQWMAKQLGPGHGVPNLKRLLEEARHHDLLTGRSSHGRRERGLALPPGLPTLNSVRSSARRVLRGMEPRLFLGGTC